jgi:PIN domain
MRLVDTSAWVEWLTGSPLGRALAIELPPRDEWLVPTIVQLELAKWLTREVGEDKADEVVAFNQTCVVSDLDTGIALSAAELCGPVPIGDSRCHHLCDRVGARRRPTHMRSPFRNASRRPLYGKINALNTRSS